MDTNTFIITITEAGVLRVEGNFTTLDSLEDLIRRLEQCKLMLPPSVATSAPSPPSPSYYFTLFADSLRMDHKLDAIRATRKLTGGSLLGAKRYVEAVMNGQTHMPWNSDDLCDTYRASYSHL